MHSGGPPGCGRHEKPLFLAHVVACQALSDLAACRPLLGPVSCAQWPTWLVGFASQRSQGSSAGGI
jgi:hypothetical protein